MDSETRITVQVQPNARENRVVRFEGGVWYVRIAAQAVKGKANRELIGFLSGILGVSKSGITIEKGMTSRRKAIAIEGLTGEEVKARVTRLLIT